MNSRERFQAVLHRQGVDFLPRAPILMQFAAEHIGSNYGAFASDYRVLVEANLRCARDFGMDQISVISDPYRETAGFGAEIEFVPDGVPRCPAPPLEHSTDLNQLMSPDPLESARMLDRINALRSYQSTPRDYSVLGWVEGPAAEAADLRGPTNFLFDLMDDREFAATLMDRCLEVGIEFARAQIDAGADTIGIGDAICSQISPKLYESLVQPREKQLVAAIHQAGALVRLHICGNITHLLPGIADLGVDMLDLDHDVDMTTARKIVGGIALGANLDPVAEVLQSSPSAIRDVLDRRYDAVGNPLVICAGCEIPSRTPVENLRALCEPVGYRE